MLPLASNDARVQQTGHHLYSSLVRPPFPGALWRTCEGHSDDDRQCSWRVMCRRPAGQIARCIPVQLVFEYLEIFRIWYRSEEEATEMTKQFAELVRRASNDSVTRKLSRFIILSINKTADTPRAAFNTRYGHFRATRPDPSVAYLCVRIFLINAVPTNVDDPFPGVFSPLLSKPRGTQFARAKAAAPLLVEAVLTADFRNRSCARARAKGKGGRGGGRGRSSGADLSRRKKRRTAGDTSTFRPADGAQPRDRDHHTEKTLSRQHVAKTRFSREHARQKRAGLRFQAGGQASHGGRSSRCVRHGRTGLHAHGEAKKNEIKEERRERQRLPPFRPLIAANVSQPLRTTMAPRTRIQRISCLGTQQGINASVPRVLQNYQYRFGTTTSEAWKTLYRDGGVRRFYRGIGPALIQGPMSRFGCGRNESRRLRRLACENGSEHRLTEPLLTRDNTSSLQILPTSDTAANQGMLALLDSHDLTRDFPVAVKTVAVGFIASISYFFFCLEIRILLRSRGSFEHHVDRINHGEWNGTLQTGGENALPLLRQKIAAHGIGTLWYGAGATVAATFVGHYPWFAVYNILNEKLPQQVTMPKKLARSAVIGFSASVTSDTISNSLRPSLSLNRFALPPSPYFTSNLGRPIFVWLSGNGITQVIKTYRQTHVEKVSYQRAVKEIVEKDGVIGLFGRGLRTRILTNALQGVIFSVLWRMFEDVLTHKGKAKKE
ncbi:MAG: hypothetical protein BJ554DRAFT_2285 [Olpidium bornovanus]|uniref:Mitochondrial carrier protein n=1 Tax=Olpidium bornovanus TaxID=278681 RepID=A0A8H8DLK8_9FUNG|nr:MAG: hypothetical protein BJ554DRAFT_2285 [Olpidium bornovanus]